MAGVVFRGKDEGVHVIGISAQNAKSVDRYRCGLGLFLAPTHSSRYLCLVTRVVIRTRRNLAVCFKVTDA